jgi:hypothetical protein
MEVFMIKGYPFYSLFKLLLPIVIEAVVIVSLIAIFFGCCHSLYHWRNNRHLQETIL